MIKLKKANCLLLITNSTWHSSYRSVSAVICNSVRDVVWNSVNTSVWDLVRNLIMDEIND